LKRAASTFASNRGRWLGPHERLCEVSPETLILDGQQRLTSLYRALMSMDAVETKDAKGKSIRRWYYLDMKQAVGNDDDR